MEFLTMRIPRIYHPELITAGREIALSDDAANHNHTDRKSVV